MAKSWWTSLTYKEQQKYLKHHPKSKRKITAKPGLLDRPNRGASVLKQLPPLPKLQTPEAGVLKRATDFIVKNRKAIAIALAPSLLGMRQRYDESVDNDTPTNNSRDAQLLQTALVLSDSRVRERLSNMLGLRTGVVLLGMTGLTLFTGLDLSLVLPLIASDWWDDVQSTRDPREFLKAAGAAYLSRVTHNLGNADLLRRALVRNRPETVVDDRVDETAALTVKSHHESDLNRTLAQFERVPVGEFAAQQFPESCESACVLHRIRQLDEAIPTLASVLVAAVPQRLSLSVRAKTQLTVYTRALEECNQRLRELARAQPYQQTPLAQLLKRRVAHTGYSYHTTLVRDRYGAVRVAEVHSFRGVDVGGRELGSARVFGFYESGSLELASVLGTERDPRAFDSVRPRSLTEWLKDVGLVETNHAG